MNAEQNVFFDFVARIEDDFLEIDSVIVRNLKESNSEYADMRQELLEMQQACPAIAHLLEGSDAVSLTADEHEAFLRYLDLERRIGDAERMQIYFRGHMDAFSYLKKISAV
jgi:hypothetical protein